jgi:hypothetical protein
MSNLSRPLVSTAHWTALLTPLFVLGFAGGFALHLSLARAQTPQVRVTELQCSSDPESVAITNQDATAQTLTGWSLKSDPVASESYDLSSVGILAPGITIFVESGPAASGTFVWSQSPIFRDGDPTDFVRIVDNNGATVHEVNCQGTSATPVATPTAAPTSAPTAPPASPTTRAPASTPTAAPVGVVPLGGGPPAPSSGVFAVILLAVGLLAIGVGIFALPHRSAAGGPSVGPASQARAFRATARRSADGRWVYMVALAVLAVVAFVSGGRRRR